MYGVVLYTDDVQLLHGTFLIYDQCTYSSEVHKYFFTEHRRSTAMNKTLVYVCVRHFIMYMYVCI